MSLKEYKPGTAFTAVVGCTHDQSEPAWPEPPRARKGVPNVLFIVLDDTGFGHLGLLRQSYRFAESGRASPKRPAAQ